MLLANTNLINDANLVAYHKFDGNANDSKNANNLSTTGTITYSNGLYNQAAANGTTGISYLSIASDLVSTNLFSVVGWIRPQAQISSGSVGLFFLGKNPPNSFMGQVLYDYNSGNPRVSLVRALPGVRTDQVFGTITLPIQYFHIAYVWNSTVATFYVNGSSIASVSSLGFGSGGFTDIYSIMVDSAGALPMYGNFDDWAVFTRALSAAEIGTLAIKPPSGILGGEI